ncbi:MULTISPECIES: ABC transporter permease [Achromobacter]|uniref:ABC transporter permease n=1 Tax=Achromobacter spanius TaxID=217203 RepID=A0ABY8H046_9BURK|nr:MULTISPECIES: ABC transporter permease [Achromobacter]WAI85671.1 ABC transporter permease [Achromobacter spanius]WEX95753.1 ABC transporter permease [Achromobacter sp. SS2-2022]WFP10527.1 ABC transporter permease [Achromobacter spanius]
MSLSGLLSQLLNGLADASALFLVSAGLSLIFGVTRVVNFAHGSFYMLGVYLAWTFTTWFGDGPAYWAGLLLAALVTGLIGAAAEWLVLKRLYRAPELFQLLATFALVLIIGDAALAIWGPEDLFAARAPGLSGAVQILGRRFPQYDLLLIAAGPIVLGLLWLLLMRTRWGRLLRAAAENRSMLAALGVNQAWLFTSAFTLGAFLAGLGGALAAPRVPATLGLDLEIIASAFVVVVVGGLGSIPGAFLAALLICCVKAVFVFLGQVHIGPWVFNLSKLTLLAEFAVMAIVLVVRPWGLLGKPPAPSSHVSAPERPIAPAGRRLRLAYGLLLLLLALVPVATLQWPYLGILMTEILIAALFAASLHFLTGLAGMTSFGHAAWFGLGAYGAALLLKLVAVPMEAALLLGPFAAAIGALLFGWFCVRLSGVYLAMLTLAVAQILWALAYQWDDVTGGSNGLIGLWPSPWLTQGPWFYYLTLAVCAAGILWLRRLAFSPLGYALRGVRDSPLRAEALGMDTRRVQWAGFVAASFAAGMAGSLYAFSKGSIAPDVMAVSRSVDGLVMVLLGGLQTLAGPLVGAAAYTWLQDAAARSTEYWHAVLGLAILALVMVFPDGLAGAAARLRGRRA